MNIGEPVLVRANYLGIGDPERVDGMRIDTVMVKLDGWKRPFRIPMALIEPADRSHIRITEVDFVIDRSRFSKTVRRLRQSANLSQTELADQIGVSQKTVSKWENGEVAPRLDRLSPLASVLGVSVSDMLETIDGLSV